MDSFTLAVLIGDASLLIAFVLLVMFDKKGGATDSAKPAGKRSA
jgi:hypothetical protein